jgi:hypothetical protein
MQRIFLYWKTFIVGLKLRAIIPVYLFKIKMLTHNCWAYFFFVDVMHNVDS